MYMYVYVSMYMYMYINIYIYVYIYIYIYIYLYYYASRLAGRDMLNWEYIGICCYLTCISLHLPILSL